MLSETTHRDVYREQLTQLVESLSLGRTDGARHALADNSPVMCLQLYAGGSLEKRRKKLEQQLEFLGAAFEDFGELLTQYVGSVHAPAYESGPDDGLRFLDWIADRPRPTPEQNDFLACQRARMAIESKARTNRLGHTRFQELWSLAELLVPELEMNPHLQIHLNPIHVWSTLTTRTFLDDSARLPADVLFFPVQRTVATALLEKEGRALVQELTSMSPCTLATWACISKHADRAQLIEFCHNLTEMGLVAFG